MDSLIADREYSKIKIKSNYLQGLAWPCLAITACKLHAIKIFIIIYTKLHILLSLITVLHLTRYFNLLCLHFFNLSFKFLIYYRCRGDEAFH